MNRLMENILTIHGMIDDVSTFIPIKLAIESINTNLPAYKKIVENTDKVIEVLEAFIKLYEGKLDL